MVFPNHLTAHTNFLHPRVTLKGIRVQGLPKLGLLGGEFSNNLVNLRLAETGRAGHRRSLGIGSGLLAPGQRGGGANQEQGRKRESGTGFDDTAHMRFLPVK